MKERTELDKALQEFKRELAISVLNGIGNVLYFISYVLIEAGGELRRAGQFFKTFI